MDEFKKNLITLLHYPNTSWNNIFQILKKDPGLESFHPYKSARPLQMVFSTIGKPFTQSSLDSFHPDIIFDQIQQYQKNNIHVITYFDKEYPSCLKEIYQPPWALFAKGDLSLLEKGPKLAVVGSRQSTLYGKNAIQTLFPKLIGNKLLIVSGLAKGIDTLAHEFAIKYGGRTIGVIAGGFEHIYPRENMNLALEMMDTQLVLSEYPPDTRPRKWHFPARNRIISGLSQGTFIIEAKRKSGSLITANFALNEGREVFALPGSIFNPFSLGTNDLIQQGAKLVTKPEDILEEIR
ncbi:DNA-processing protein DprA [Neobacillus mesonae]|uniref:DNA-processing protein DprA n=1 Tax=Neobacillus mesonae TaxID=1193713 RepID=UPI00203D6077|nr:DNA-processing protein DprA [Neobacillus mesonae]MCM3569078.1 DNA-processing protein DprA [Neobacillus mesonae]